MKSVIFEDDGYSVCHRPNAWRIRQPLEGGRWLSLFFKRRRILSPTKKEKQACGNICYIWTVAVHVGKTRKSANKWYHRWSKKDANRVTGDGCLYALRQALAYIRVFVSDIMGIHDELRISGSDAKRNRVWRYLLRYPGFLVDASNPFVILARNPNIYVFVEKGG